MKIRIYILFLFLLTNALNIKAQSPVAAFSNNISSGCDVVPVAFTDLSTNTPTSWKWYFGNGVTSTLKNPIYAYTVPGTYSVKLVVTNASGSDSITKTSLITVFQSPTAHYNADIITGCPPLTINLTDNSTPGSSAITSYQWDFGNGGSSTNAITSTTYNNPGSYFISLRITDANGCVKFSINTDSVKIHAAPVVNFTSDINASCNAPLTVNFTNSSTGNSALTYNWDFGDGGTSNATNPSHTYNNPGSYNVTLTATDQTNCATTLVKNSFINITGIVDYHANFSASDTSGCSSNVSFTDMSSIGAESWIWNFGDSTTSFQQNPHHSYASSGNYTVSLVSSNSLSCANRPIDSIQKVVHITIYNTPTVNFNMDDSTGCNAPFSVNFTSIAPSAVSYQWDFGDGSSSNQQNPSHTFNAMGNYTVSLTITDINGCSATSIHHVVMSLPTADFAADLVQGCAPLNVNFTDASTSNYPITNWNWDFGDGNTSTSQNPNHIYADTGRYDVTLVITDGNGCQNTLLINDYIEVGLKPITSFSADDFLVCANKDVNFLSTSSSWVEAWDWDFGDGGSATVEDPSHKYRDTGYFDVQLIVEHHGCYDTLTKLDYIYVMPPIASFTGNPISSCSAPLTTNFTNTSIGAQTYEWDFGDGSPAEFIEHPSHTYTLPGMYDVRLIVTATNPEFCSDTSTYYRYIKISEINLGFTQSDTFSCQHGIIFFNDTSTANTPIIKYIWDYGDGTIDTLLTQSTFHVFDSAGVFSVTHTVIDSLGCSSTITIANCITIQQTPDANFTADTSHGCVPLIVGFDPSTSAAFAPATLTSWQWDFGDGSVVQTLNNGNIVHHTYAQRSFPNSYTPSLLVTDSKGCSDFIALPNHITATFPYPDISHPNTICFYDSLQITNNSTGVGLNYLWDFGDGSATSTDPSPSHFYNVAQTDTFTITLTVTDINNCDSTISSTVKVSRPIANFYHDSITSNCPPVFVLFHDSSTTDVTSFLWDFGDSLDANNNSIMEDPQHRYNKAGDYFVSLTVTNGDGCIDKLTSPAVQIQGPKGTINYGPKFGCAPLQVNFTANTSDANQYLWIYGNGAAQAGQNTTYVYPDSGSFFPIISLTDTNTNCSFNIVGTDPITVYPRPKAYFTANDGCTNSPLFFSDSSTIYQNDQINNWDWLFDDGNSGVGQSTNHTYTTNGTYNPEMIITTVRGCKDTASRAIESYVPIANFLFQNVCINTPVSFTDSSYSENLVVSTYFWDFGDGSTSNQANPTHTYNSSGNFTINLTVNDSRGCSGVKTKTITIYPQPVLNYSHSPFCPDIPGTFINLSTDASGISANSWTFGDGGTSNLSNPNHAYTTTGIKNIQLISTSGNGCKDTLISTLIVNPKPIPNYTTQNTCVGVATNYINTSTINPTNIQTWTWIFDDGTTQLDTDTASKTYNTNGIHNSKLIVQSDSGCIDSISKSISVFANPTANFTALPNCIFSQSNFTDTSSPAEGPINNWIWRFDDGNNANIQNPNHLFANAGNHNTTLVITDSNGCIDSITKASIVNPQPIALFSHPTFCPGIPETFTNLSTDASGITANSWTFGDGGTSNSSSPNHAYNLAGIKPVQLITTSGNGCKDTLAINIVVNPRPTPNYTSQNTCVGVGTNYINTSSINPTTIQSWTWHFEDGTTSNTTDTVNKTYNLNGIYQTTLIVTSDSGCIDSVSHSIQVFTNPTADFNVAPACIFTTSTFNNASNQGEGPFSSWLWHFGDGINSNTQNTSHIYTSSGTQNATLIVNDIHGCIDSITKPVIVYPQPIAGFTNTTICQTRSVLFTNTSTDASGISFSNWTFGDGGTSMNSDPTHTYLVSGNKNIQLIVGSGNGCSDTIVKTRMVNPMPIPDFDYENPCANTETIFINQSSISAGDIVLLTWRFGDGFTHTGNDTVSHIYTNSGIYSPQLIVRSDSACIDTISQSITVFPIPSANFAYSTTCLNDSTRFIDFSSSQQGTITDYSWNFGDTTFSILQHPMHLYEYAGNFMVNLEITNSNGCIKDTSITIHVNYLPHAQFDMPDTLCERVEFTIEDQSTNPQDSHIDTWNWNFGNGGTSNDTTPTYAYPTHGNYTVNLEVETLSGCKDTANKKIVVLPSPISFYSAYENPTTVMTPNIAFTNLSTNAVDWNWTFGDGGTSTDWNPHHEYADTGTYRAILTVYNALNCPNVFARNIIINPEFAFYIPNAFTPGNDVNNDRFNGYGICIAEYELRVYNRWGGLTFESKDQHEGWNGRMMNKGDVLPEDVYVYKFYLTDYKGEKHEYIGHVTLVR